MEHITDPRRTLPSVDQLLRWPVISAFSVQHGKTLLKEIVAEQLSHLRAEAVAFDADAFCESVQARLTAVLSPSLRQVFNLTGTVLHTNLGRAPLPEEAIEAMAAVARGASNLEFDLHTGRRGDRDAHLESWLCRLTGAEAATVVNNNAAAVLLMLNTLAKGKEVPVSRGELVEIGGAFRMPDVMQRAQCRLREVGTTNRTHLADYADAIGQRTGILMTVHTSNYKVVGFTASVPEQRLAHLAQEHGIPYAVDLGSGSLVDLSRWGLPAEPTPMASLGNGVDLVSFSGDKLLGGPQCGIIIGRRDLIDRLKKNPLKRALRCDKLTIAALEAVLRLYADPDRLAERLPSLRALSRSQTDVAAQCARLLDIVATWAGSDYSVSSEPVMGQIGSGALPIEHLHSQALIVRPVGPSKGSGSRLTALAARLRALPVPVIGRVQDASVILDCRCLEDEATFCKQLRAER
ncbi:L-seryl-tRNA(Sec) selenium transferase [Halopseudomonas nanhaiensis]|uniref:L-seryl-tRNA(Sec) selenium transferase n=1 Tax=Halopseudomonas nanhaiensis TaxID=2830842 RepID=UPI001CC0FF77|nr:L-seryl-tRNA(Sec) selenium transferase [Halopseudomonas nanhaiensis]UAW99684.1 L-seryl-tRNA(Sec) selenium transferase [Halopseudomonas nanhaiensis]